MKALCITRLNQPERRKRAEERLSNLNLDLHFVTAMDGDKSGLVTTHTYEIDNPGSGYVIGPITVGIYLSHYVAWQICDALPDSHVLILEDDAVPHERFMEKMEACISRTPADFDFLFLGSCATESQWKTRIKDDVWEVHYPQCLHAYIVAKKAIPTLLKEYQDVCGPVDCMLCAKKFSGLKVYTVLPRIVDQFETILCP